MMHPSLSCSRYTADDDDASSPQLFPLPSAVPGTLLMTMIHPPLSCSRYTADDDDAPSPQLFSLGVQAPAILSCSQVTKIDGSMTGEEGGAGGGGGGGGGASVSAMCLVCGTNQANLTQHLARHSKEEIIRAVTHGRPLPELATRRQGPSRPRKIALPQAPLATVAPLSLRPATSQPQLVMAGSQPQPPPVTATMAPTPQAAPPPQSAASQPVRLSTIAPLMQPPRTGMPITSSAVQPSTAAPAGNYLLIGNNMFPAGGVISNNLQLGSSGVSYIIPSSGGLVLAAAAPPTGQTLLVQPPNAAPAPPLPVKQATAVPPMVTLPAGIYNGVTCRPPRPVQSDGSQCMFEGPAAPVQNEANPPATDAQWQKPLAIMSEPSNGSGCVRTRDEAMSESHRATISIGKNISISLPRELVGQKDKLKDIINQELVRALLMNETKKGQNPNPGQPSTSGGDKTIYYPSKMEEDEAVSVCQVFYEEDDHTIEVDEDVQCYGDTHEEDPLASDPLASTPRSGRSPGGSLTGSSMVSPVSSVATDSTLSGGFIIPDAGAPYSSDGSMEVVYNDRNHCGQTSARSDSSLGNEGCERGIARQQQLVTHGGHEVKGEDACHRRQDKPGDTAQHQAVAAGSTSGPQGEFGQVAAPPITPSNVGQPIRRQVGEGEQPMSFLPADRTFNTLLGTTGLQPMEYVEEQVLGAVEQVFSGAPSVSTSTVMPCAGAEAGGQKLVQRRLGHPYAAGVGEHLSQLPAPSYRDTTQDKEQQDVKCKYEVSGLSSQQGSSVSQMVAAATPYQSPHRDTTQGNKEEVKCKYEAGGSTGQLASSMSHGAAGTAAPYESHQHQHRQNTLELGSSLSTAEKLEMMRREEKVDEEEEELVDDPSLVDSMSGGAIFPDDPMFDREMSGQQGDEVMSLKASETLADSDSERATPHEELSDLMFYDRSCMFAGEPGPANLSPRTYPPMGHTATTPSPPPHLSPWSPRD
ncbi:hypothetical protein GWK47_047368 [Chionoecetes opilio]|uniref:Uncharacterized protein n=1 Tax=Chionoecetes opilio TaxID=41210 RepID=A0A8J4Y4Q5_CHIOP|nr:hypothetical protein GWK47_047368 [Chionoecetes opilio]